MLFKTCNEVFKRMRLSVFAFITFCFGPGRGWYLFLAPGGLMQLLWRLEYRIIYLALFKVCSHHPHLHFISHREPHACAAAYERIFTLFEFKIIKFGKV